MTDPKNPSKVEGLHAPEPGRRVLIKGQQTKTVIIDAALGLASQIGLEGLSIGAVAEVTGMSKSGVFAHFGSREELQISVIREYHDRFEAEVFYAAMQMPRGLPRLQALFDNWMVQTSAEIDSGCIYSTAADRCAMRWLLRCPPGKPLCAGLWSWHKLRDSSAERPMPIKSLLKSMA